MVAWIYVNILTLPLYEKKYNEFFMNLELVWNSIRVGHVVNLIKPDYNLLAPTWTSFCFIFWSLYLI